MSPPTVNGCSTRAVSRHANIWRLDLRGAAPVATSLTRGTSSWLFPRVSPDGQWIVATQGTESDPRIVKIPIGGGEPVQLAAGSAAVWSPDGQRLAFVTGGRAAQRVWISDADGLGPKEVKDAASGNFSVTWLSDGRLAWQTQDARNYRIRDLASGREELLVKNPEVGWVFEPHFSPRGDQVAVFWNRAEGTQTKTRTLASVLARPRGTEASRRICGPSDGRKTATGSMRTRPQRERSSESLLARPG